MDIHRVLWITTIGYVCVGIFLATAVAVVLDLFNVLKLAPDIRKKLHAVLVAEVIGIAIAAFKGVLDTGQITNQVKAQIDTTDEVSKRLYATEDKSEELLRELKTLREEVVSLRRSNSLSKPPEVNSETVPKPMSIEERIAQGESFRVSFDGPRCPNDQGIAGTWETDPLGTLICGQSYIVRYDRGSDTWYTTGPHEALGTVKTYAYKGTRPENHQLNLWGRVFKFDKAGVVEDMALGNVGKVIF